MNEIMEKYRTAPLDTDFENALAHSITGNELREKMNNRIDLWKWQE
ncbi:MAG: hypothetical protein LBN95_10555 [Prevotellaceae bacterium]|jgi:hypothetical protein|nr:hypothetical protein [Prevotellaceae bacterium]